MTHYFFLQRLKAMLAHECCPIIVTDAGFRTPWFREIESLSWDWVGRIRNRHMIKYCNNSDNNWQDCKTCYPHATSTAKHLGRVQLIRN